MPFEYGAAFIPDLHEQEAVVEHSPPAIDTTKGCDGDCGGEQRKLLQAKTLVLGEEIPDSDDDKVGVSEEENGLHI